MQKLKADAERRWAGRSRERLSPCRRTSMMRSGARRNVPVSSRAFPSSASSMNRPPLLWPTASTSYTADQDRGLRSGWRHVRHLDSGIEQWRFRSAGDERKHAARRRRYRQRDHLSSGSEGFPTDKPEAVARLREAAIEAKHRLSTIESTAIEIPFLDGATNFSHALSRDELERLSRRFSTRRALTASALSRMPGSRPLISTKSSSSAASPGCRS